MRAPMTPLGRASAGTGAHPLRLPEDRYATGARKDRYATGARNWLVPSASTLWSAQRCLTAWTTSAPCLR